MRLRTKLVLAFLLLSVVPLTTITLYSYSSSIHAFRRAVEAEEATIAADMGKRMEMATTALGDRFNRISAAAEARDWNVRDRAQDDRFRSQVAETLGDAGGFVSSLQFVPSPKQPPPAPPPPPRPRHFPRPPNRPPVDRGEPARPAQPAPAQAAAPEAPAEPVSPKPQAPKSPAPAGGVAGGTTVDVGTIIDLIPQGSLPPDAQKALADLKNLTISLPTVVLNQKTAAALEAAAKRVEQRAQAVERRYQADLRDLMRQRPEMQSWFNRMKEGKPVDIPVRRDGRVVGTMNAEIRIDRLVHSVLGASGNQETGEIAFAIDPQNRLIVRKPDDRTKLESLRPFQRVRNSKDAVQTVSDENWVVVARQDPSGFRFGIARPIGDALGDIRRATGRNLGLGMLAILVALAGIVPISSRMTRNLSVLQAGVKRIAQGDLGARVNVKSKDEIGTLGTAFNQMAEDLAAHQKLIAERERLRGELELCRQIQTEMLPKQPLRLGFAEIKGVSIPAREVGGDFFNYFLMPEGEVAVLVGDVSGKGVGAALLMANVQATLRARLSLAHDLPALADEIDHEIDESTPKSVYLTLFMGILDGSHRTLRYVNAGHNPQFVLRANGGLDRLPSTGLPIAMFAGHGYKEGSVTLNEGDILFFYTDGITEVENEQGDMFGTERLEALVGKHHEEGVDALLAHIEQEVLAFRGAADLFDDATMMVLRLGAAVADAPAPSL